MLFILHSLKNFFLAKIHNQICFHTREITDLYAQVLPIILEKFNSSTKLFQWQLIQKACFVKVITLTFFERTVSLSVDPCQIQKLNLILKVASLFLDFRNLQ